MKSFLQLVLLIFCITCLSTIVTAEEPAGSWLDAWRDAVGMEVSDPTPVFGDLDGEKDAVGEDDLPRKKFVSPPASDAKIPGETDTVPAAADRDIGAKVARLNPNALPLNALISQWLRVAEPPINATKGAKLYYDEWGRMLGQAVGGVITASGKPDGVGARTSTEYVWSFRDQLDSVDHCTLGEYVAKRIGKQTIDDCRGRYKPIVADVVGMTKSMARKKLSGMGFNVIALKTRAKSAKQSSLPEDAMIVESSRPAAGTAADRGATVYIVLRYPKRDIVASTKPPVTSKPAARTDPRQDEDDNPFAGGGGNEWISLIQDRERGRSEQSASRRQSDAASSNSTDRAVFTSDGQQDEMTGIHDRVKEQERQNERQGEKEPTYTPPTRTTTQPEKKAEVAEKPATQPSPPQKSPRSPEYMIWITKFKETGRIHVGTKASFNAPTLPRGERFGGVGNEPLKKDPLDFGPFKTIDEAKKKACSLISNAREEYWPLGPGRVERGDYKGIVYYIEGLGCVKK